MTATFWWIVGSGLLMSAIALVGSVTLLLPERALHRLLLPLVAFAAGARLGARFSTHSGHRVNPHTARLTDRWVV